MTAALDAELGRAAEILRKADRLAVLTGAGVSAESGVPTFRDGGGLWEGVAIEDVATPSAFHRNPRQVWAFYNARRANLRAVRPNAGHLALARLEARFQPKHFTLVTQNVDGLHRAATSRNVIELHGNLAQTRCIECGTIADRGLEPLGELPTCTGCGGLLRPNVVWFQEALPVDPWNEAERAVRAAAALLVVGTSANVYPAAGLIDLANSRGRPVIECNLAESAATGRADVHLFGPSGVTLPQLVAQLEAGDVGANP